MMSLSNQSRKKVIDLCMDKSPKMRLLLEFDRFEGQNFFTSKINEIEIKKWGSDKMIQITYE